MEDTSRSFYDVELRDSDGVYAVDRTVGNGALLLYSYHGNLVATYGAGTLECPESVAFHSGLDLENLIPIEIGQETETSALESLAPYLISAVIIIIAMAAAAFYLWSKKN